MVCYITYVMSYNMLCYITGYVIKQMLYDICYGMLYNMYYVVLYNICYIMLCYITCVMLWTYVI